MSSENKLVEKMVTTHTSPSIAELVNMKFLSLWVQDIADQMELAERTYHRCLGRLGERLRKG